jgi:hypothetical protein
MPADPAEVAALARRARNVVAQAILRAAFLPSTDLSSHAVGRLVDRMEPLHRLTRTR